MSKFINYKKRSVTLPGACKDLVDLLQPHGLPKPVSKIHAGALSPAERPTVTRGESFTGRLSDIEKYVTMVFDSRARSFLLMVTPPDETVTVYVDRMEGATMDASIVVQSGTVQESAVRSFFAHRGLRIPEDSGMPPQFNPNLPVHLAFDIAPLPSEAALLAKLVAELFRDAFGVSDDSPLCFRYDEFRDAACR